MPKYLLYGVSSDQPKKKLTGGYWVPGGGGAGGGYQGTGGGAREGHSLPNYNFGQLAGSLYGLRGGEMFYNCGFYKTKIAKKCRQKVASHNSYTEFLRLANGHIQYRRTDIYYTAVCIYIMYINILIQIYILGFS